MRECIVVAVACLVACSGEPSDGYTDGELGRIKFSLSEYASNRHCYDGGCGIDKPLLVGTTELLDAYNTEQRDDGSPVPLPVLHAASSDPSVLAVIEHPCCRYPSGGFTCSVTYNECFAVGGEVGNYMAIELKAVGEGRAHVVLYTDDDPAYDYTVIETRRAGSLELHVVDDAHDADAAVTSLSLAGRHTTMRGVARDASGNELFATHGIEMSLGGDVAAFYGKYTTTREQDYTTTRTQVWPLSLGTDELVLRAGSLTTSVPVTSH